MHFFSDKQTNHEGSNLDIFQILKIFFEFFLVALHGLITLFLVSLRDTPGTEMAY